MNIRNKDINFRNDQLFAGGAKTINLENTLSNLFMLMSTGGAPVTLITPRGGFTMETLIDNIKTLGKQDKIQGTSDNLEAIDAWLRSSLVNMVSRGDVMKEHITSLRPVHLMCYRIQNKKYNRDYNMSDQLYIMLRTAPEVLSALKDYLSSGWDSRTNSIVDSDWLDVDTAGILLLQQTLPTERLNNVINPPNTKPLLKEQTEVFIDDIRRLLFYKDKLPRIVFVDYLRILVGLHLSLYVMKLIYLLPKMREDGTTRVVDDWSMVVDMTNNLDSRVSKYACKDIERMMNSLYQYFKATFEINVVQSYNKIKGKDHSIEGCLRTLNEDSTKSLDFFLYNINQIKNSVDDDDKKVIDDMLQFYDQNDYFGRYIHLLEKANGGSAYQYPFHLRMIDSLSMKNSDSMLIADGRRSRKHPRRGVIGSKLLELMVQLLVLDERNGSYVSNSLSIEELANRIRDRYGLIINGLNEPRFCNADVETHAAFKENMDALKNNLRQIGFYTDLSDACILQKIRPRY